jgi:hypothetical protein
MYSRRLVIKNKEELVYKLISSTSLTEYYYIHNITEHNDHYLFHILHNNIGKTYTIRLSRNSVEGMYVMYDIAQSNNVDLLTKDKLEQKHKVLMALETIIKMDM